MDLHSIMFFFCEIENFALICKLIKEYGEFVRIWLGPELNVIVSDPKDVEVNYGIHKNKIQTQTKHIGCARFVCFDHIVFTNIC